MTTKNASLAEDYSQNYARHWFAFFLLLAVLAASFAYRTYVYRPSSTPPVAANAPLRNWFYILHMPEMPVHADVRSSRQQFTRWLDALDKEGFRFFLLSDVVRQMNQGIALPEKTVVLVFDPGYRQTADAYLSVLKNKQVPAVWLTNRKAIEAKDKRYISEHLAQVMGSSGLWDIGYYAPGSAVSLKTRDNQTIFLGQRSPWKPDAGRFALNRGVAMDSFDRLNVNAKWTEQDLVHRLLVERPVQGPALLSLQQIQGRDWGMALDIGATHDTHFTLRAPSDKRSGSLYWLGTQGINDVHLRLEVKSLVGEMRVLLRSDQAAGQDVSVVFSRGHVVVEQTLNGVASTLGSSPCPDIAPHVPFTAVLALMGRQLALAVNGHPLVALETLSEPTSNKGMIRLVVQDSLQGVGEARSVRIICTPLAKK